MDRQRRYAWYRRGSKSAGGTVQAWQEKYGSGGSVSDAAAAAVSVTVILVTAAHIEFPSEPLYDCSSSLFVVIV